ncbi:putative DNA-binding protein [Streptococcus pneumoniae GA04216]|nr:putative DNA-binding protein [Streptococcus pneumoniae GA04216]
MREVIQELLDSSMSTSAISQGAGVPWTTVSDLRKENKHGKMAPLTAEKLYEFATTDKQ